MASRIPSLQLGQMVKDLNMFKSAVKKTTKDVKLIGHVLNRVFAEKRGGFIKKIGGGAYHPTKKSIYGPKHIKAGKFTNLPQTIGTTQFKGLPKEHVFKELIDESFIGRIFGSMFRGFGKVATAPMKVAGKAKGGLMSSFSKGFDLSSAMADKAGRKQYAPQIIPQKGIGGMIKRKAFKAGGKFGQGLSSLTKLKPTQLKAAGSAFKGLAMGAAASTGIGILIAGLIMLISAMQPFKPIMDALNTIFGIWGILLNQAFIPIIERLYDVMLNDHVMDMFDRLGMLFFRLIEPLLPLVDSLFPLLFSVLNAVISVLETLMPWIQILFLFLNIFIIPITILTVLIELFCSVLQILSGVTQSVVDIIVKFSNGLWDSFNNLTDSVIGIFDGLVDFVLNAFDSILQGVKDWVNGIIGVINNGLIGGINSILTDINDVLGSNISLLPNIPYLGTGGIVTSPMLAVVGDRPEAIVPLDDYNSGGQITINVYVENVADDSMIEKLANRIREEVERQKYWSQ